MQEREIFSGKVLRTWESFWQKQHVKNRHKKWANRNQVHLCEYLIENRITKAQIISLLFKINSKQ
jgi:hypothetical protein